ncbi:uncharacterized protein LOC100294694 [Nasonia vitripennis]|uniref:Choline transporter-like protein n=1 Tax=Nasonia vitripennis TaxID=7425 RepID=A0A7M6W5M0_NASVI|nr:uncharacterized protein LOC100294694 [Nasonia vitripennis]
MEGSPFIPRASILNRDRTVTNKVLLIIFSVLFAIWVPIVIYAFCVGDVSSLFPKNSSPSIKAFNVTSFFIVLGYSMLAGSLSIVLFVAMRYIPKFSYCVLFTFWMPVVYCTLAAVYKLSLQSVWVMIGSYLSCVFVFYLLQTEWLHLPEGILKESCNAVMFFPSAIGFSILINFAALLVLVLTIVVVLLLKDLNTFLALLIQLLDVVIGIWAMSVILLLGLMSLSSTYATWFWTANKNEIPNATVLRAFKLNSKYHLGTAAFGTTIIGPVYSFYLVLAHGISKFMDDYDKAYIFFFIYNFFDAIALKFTFIGSIVKCAINGTNYQESATRAINDLEEHPRRCLVVTKVFEYVLTFIGCILVLCVGLSIFAYVSIDFGDISSRGNIVLWAIVFGGMMFVLPMFWTISSAYYTILFCVIEDLEIHNGTQERPFVMSQKLHEAVNHNGPPASFHSCMTCCGAINTDQRIE